MMDNDKSLPGDEAILADIGQRLARRRLDLQMTQAELARQAGVGRATIERLEAGHSLQMTSIVRVLRALGLVESLLSALPEPGIRPMDLVRLRDKMRKRAPGRRTRKATPSEPWTWADEE